ncbi:MAG: spheroidene monooxygenase [Fulvivirga sp.]
MSQITTITFFKYRSFTSKLWAFIMMQNAHSHLTQVAGLQFYKLMGSGKGAGFNPLPDWSVYALIQVWESEEEAMMFFNKHELMHKYRRNASHIWTIFMKSILSKGEWSGNTPFIPHGELDDQNKCIAVITRATIKWSKMIRFWSFVPKSQRPLKEASGLIYTKGVGEAPLVQMATFSIWKGIDKLHDFAYSSEEHQKAIKFTRELGWYKEELFARFQPYKTKGSWESGNPLKPIKAITNI